MLSSSSSRVTPHGRPSSPYSTVSRTPGMWPRSLRFRGRQRMRCPSPSAFGAAPGHAHGRYPRERTERLALRLALRRVPEAQRRDAQSIERSDVQERRLGVALETFLAHTDGGQDGVDEQQAGSPASAAMYAQVGAMSHNGCPRQPRRQVVRGDVDDHGCGPRRVRTRAGPTPAAGAPRRRPWPDAGRLRSVDETRPWCPCRRRAAPRTGWGRRSSIRAAAAGWRVIDVRERPPRVQRGRFPWRTLRLGLRPAWSVIGRLVLGIETAGAFRVRAVIDRAGPIGHERIGAVHAPSSRARSSAQHGHPSTRP